MTSILRLAASASVTKRSSVPFSHGLSSPARATKSGGILQECHHVSGEFPYVLKIWAHDLQHLERLLNDKIKARAGVVRTQMSIVLSYAKDHVTGLTARL